MSKLAKAIDATFTGNVKATRDLNLRYTDVQFNVSDRNSDAREYRLLVKLQQMYYLSASDLADGHAKDEVRKLLTRSMIEEVFGEFRPIIFELQSAMYLEDKQRMITLLTELEHKMFVEGL